MPKAQLQVTGADTFSLEANADLTAKQYHLMRYVATEKVDQASEAVQSKNIGVLLNKPKSGEGATIADGGIVPLVAGAAITAGDVLATNGSGRAAAVASGQIAMARALTAAGADGETITARMFRPFRWSGAA